MTAVRVVVLNYDGGDDVLRSLEALSRVEWGGDLEVVVIDNGSSDGSDDAVAERHPEVRLVRTGANLGFGANNLELRDLDGVDYVALLNNDAFVEPGWLAPLVEALDRDERLGAVQSKILLEPRFVEVSIETTASTRRFDPRRFGVEVRGLRVGDDDRWDRAHLADGGHGPSLEADPSGSPVRVEWTAPRAVVRVPLADGAEAPYGSADLLLNAPEPKSVRLASRAGEIEVEVGPEPAWVTVPLGGQPVDVVNSVGGLLLADGSAADRGYLEADRGQYDDQVEIDAWCGGSVLLRPSYLADVGLLDERFFLYYEDTDLSWRGRARGWRYAVVPRSVVRHVHAAGSGEASALLRWHVERNRLIFLTNAAPGLAARAALHHPLSTVSYLRRDVVGPWLDGRPADPTTVRLRSSAYLGFLRLAPALLAERTRRRGAEG